MPEGISANETEPFLPSLTLWKDTRPRCGEDNMAADELLLSLPGSWLRIYHWSEPTVTYGVFDTRKEAQRIFPASDIRFVRRWTGGGIVDHRNDTPFTLSLSRENFPVPPLSAALYAWIHGELASVFRAIGIECHLLSSDAPDGGRACWASPVTSDITDEQGRKLAGGGQRRTPHGILHQGSIQGCTPAKDWDELFAARLSAHVHIISGTEPVPGFEEKIAVLSREKYASAQWNDESKGRRR